MRISTLFLSLFLSLTLAAQVDDVDSTKTAIEKSLDNTARRALFIGRSLPTERVFLQFDNSAYFLGETLWFKAFVTSGNYDHATTLSKVLYVDIVAPEGYIVESKKYKLDENGCCHGEFDLNVLMLSGYYEVRAYTRYMLNWGSEAIFSRVFPVFDKVNANNWDFKNMLDRKRSFMYRGKWQSAELPDCDLKFYPEGGHIVDGLESKVAYELRGRDGEFGEDSIVIYEDGAILTTAVPEHNGKGVFKFTPKAGSKYRAEVYALNKKEKRERFRFDLPKIETQGVTMSITDEGDSVRFIVRNNFVQSTELGFAILYRGAMGIFKKYLSDEKEYTLKIGKNALLEGVNRAVVFTSDVPLAERQFFIEHTTLQKNDRETVKLNVEANNYHVHNLKPQAHEKISISIEREDGKPIDENAELSIAVTDVAGGQSTSWGYNIYTYMLLGSELKGYIPEASQYFDKNNVDRAAHLDLIMLTHGWTSYDWSKLTATDISNLQPVETGITIKGRLFEKRKNLSFGARGTYTLKPEKDNLSSIDISYDNETIERSMFRTDKDGSFILEVEDFYGKRIAILAPSRRFKHTTNVWYGYSLDRYYSPSFRSYDYWERNLGRSIKRESKDSIMGAFQLNPFEYMLSSVEVTAEKKKEQNSRPPHSEMRFDFLDEWEYAQDITFLKEAGMQDDVAQFAIDEYFMENMMEVDIESYQTENAEDTDLLEEQKEESGEVKNILDYMTPSGIINLKTEGSSKYLGRIRYGSSGKISGNVDYTYERALTAEDVVKSAMYRHNYNWAYWVQLMAVAGEYDPDSIPRPDNDYYKGKDPAKMMNFKEFVIRSDIRTREQFENNGINWERLANALDNKTPDTKFYLGFMSQTYLVAKEGVDGAPNPTIFMDRLTAHQDLGLSYPRNPNYVACMIPYKEEEMGQGKIVPDLLGNGTIRYTSVKGYNESKEFYSPDYSGMTPTANNDYRRTLLWNPEAKVVDGKLVVELHNSSWCEAIEVNVSGMGSNTYYSNDSGIETRIHEDGNSHVARKSESKLTMLSKSNKKEDGELASQYELCEIYINMQKYRSAIPILAELIQHGYAPAQRTLGLCYLNGWGVSQNNELGIEFLEEAVKGGDAKAMYEAAIIYRDGVIAEKDEKRTTELLEQAIEGGEPRAQATLGKYYFNKKDMARAGELLKASALQNNAEGLYLYGMYMIETNREDAETGTALTCIEKAAEADNIEAQLFMMRHHDKAQEYEIAYKWAHKLYVLKNREGTQYLADCYMNGRGVRRDKGIAKDLYREIGIKK